MTPISEQPPAHHHPNARLPIWETFGLTFRVFGRAPGKFIGLILINILVSGLLALIGKLADGESWAPIMATAIEIANLAVQLIVNGAFVVGIDDILRRGTFDFDGALGSGFAASERSWASGCCSSSSSFWLSCSWSCLESSRH